MRNSAPQGWLENPSFTHFSSKLTPSQRQQIPHHTYRQFKKSTVTQKEKTEAHACNPTDSAPSRCPTGNPPPPFLIFLVNVSFYFPLYITQIQMIIIKSAQLTLAKPTKHFCITSLWSVSGRFHLTPHRREILLLCFPVRFLTGNKVQDRDSNKQPENTPHPTRVNTFSQHNLSGFPSLTCVVSA